MFFLLSLICVSDSWQLQFIPSEFRGQLPKPFAEGPLATRIVPTDMNDQNLEEPSRYVRMTVSFYLLKESHTLKSVGIHVGALMKWGIS